MRLGFRSLWLVSVCACTLLCACSTSETIAVDVQVLYPIGGKMDDSIADRIYAGVVTARTLSSFTFEEVEPASTDDADAALRRWFDEVLEDSRARRLVIVGASTFAPLVEARACDFGVAHVVVLDAATGNCRTLRSVTYRTFAPAFLAGVASVADRGLNPDRTVGIIGGADIAPVREIMDGFAAGVAFAGGTVVRTALVSADPDAGFSDEETAAALARSMLDDAGVILAAAGASSRGVARVLDEHFASGPKRPVYLVGADTDHSYLYAEITLGSILKRFDRTVRDAALDAVAGTFSSGDVRVGLPDDFTELFLRPSVAARVLEGDCSECDPYTPSCDDACTTLQDVVDAATAEALAQGQSYEAGVSP